MATFSKYICYSSIVYLLGLLFYSISFLGNARLDLADHALDEIVYIGGDMKLAVPPMSLVFNRVAASTGPSGACVTVYHRLIALQVRFFPVGRHLFHYTSKVEIFTLRQCIY